MRRSFYDWECEIQSLLEENQCHGGEFLFRHLDLTTRNIALGLSKQLDHLSENKILDLFPPKTQEIRLQSEDQINSESRSPKYAVEAVDLARLPSNYLSSKLYILDFDQAYSSLKQPHSLLGITPRYLAPESIFELRNGPPADVWTLGCLIFRMRCGVDICHDLPETPSNAISKMYGILGRHLLDHWKTVPFDGDGWPALDGLQEGIDYHDFSGHYDFPYKSLWDYVMESIDLKRAKKVEDEVGILKFCRYLPTAAFRGCYLKQEWAAENATPITRKEADSFYDLMLQVFEYDPGKRITVSGMLLHPWFEGK
jgi:serine/threonine protein kinase